MGAIEPTAAQIGALAALADDGSPIVMINLLRYLAQAAYPEGFEAEPCSGREAYRRYGEVALQRVAAAGGRIVWMGAVAATAIAPEGEQWDDVVLVEYPSPRAFLDMIAQPEYLAAAPHRTAALADSRLIATHAPADQPGSD